MPAVAEVCSVSDLVADLKVRNRGRGGMEKQSVKFGDEAGRFPRLF